MPARPTPLRCATLVALLAAAVPVGAQSLPPGTVTIDLEEWHDRMRTELRDAAAATPWVDVHELMFARPTRARAPREMLLAHQRARAAADACIAAAEIVLPLLEDPDPKVRVWAAYVLFRSLRAEFLPVLGELTADRAPVPTVDPIARRVTQPGKPTEPPSTRPTPVGDLARSFLSHWDAPAPGSEAFGAWCARVAEHEPTAKALELEFLLRHGGQREPSRWTSDDMFAVRSACGRARRGAAEIASVALLHRYVDSMTAAWPQASTSLEFAARRLGRDNLLRLLAGEAPVIDGEPLDPIHFEPLLDLFRDYVLERPARLGLVPEDARRLQQLGRQHERATFFHGAARLRPGRATSILRAAMDRSTHPWNAFIDAQTACLLWDLQPAQNVEFLEDWFHTDPEAGIRMVPDRRHTFLLHLLGRYEVRDRQMFARLVHDPRFERCPPNSLEWIAAALDQTSFEPLFDPGLTLNFMHPLGLGRAFADLHAAREAHPDMTRDMLRRMTGLRDAIRDHTSGWLAD